MFALQDMITMIEKTKLRVQMDMDKARAEREAAEDTILRVLDQSTSGLLKQDAPTATRPKGVGTQHTLDHTLTQTQFLTLHYTLKITFCTKN